MEKKEHLPRVAYFCMEYGLHSDFKIYAGGLGILAGDYLKTAHDLDLPIIGVGILWKQGYTKQVLDEKKEPVDTYPIYKYEFLEDTGVKVKVKIKGVNVTCKVWKVDKFNNSPLFLLDTDLDENQNPWITGQLYGWFEEERLAQEMVLGIGGIRALRKLGLEVDLFHFNEGHAVFAGLELIREKMEDDGLDFKTAWDKTREEIVFTTHTPVIEGNEEHPHRALQYMGVYQNLNLEEMVAIGGAPFNMTVAGLRLSSVSNGVSELHSKTANKMWGNIYNRSKIIGITNGVHHSTWVSQDIIKYKDNGKKLWETHLNHKRELINFVKEKTGVQLKEKSLLIGFARRAAPYKRGDFIFTDEERVGSLFKEGKIQLIFSGKAHPLDDKGKEIVKRQVSMAEKYPDSVVFLEDYDMEIGYYLTRGCDLWLNNPRRPKEACGTSGMKAAMNGVLNLSILDGWWPEACIHGVNGWQFGDGLDQEDFKGSEEEKIKKQDQHDLKSLYEVLLKEVIPTYYQDREKWINMMQESINTTYTKFSSEKMMENYYKKMYDIDEYVIIE